MPKFEITDESRQSLYSSALDLEGKLRGLQMLFEHFISHPENSSSVQFDPKGLYGFSLLLKEIADGLEDLGEKLSP